MKVVFACTREEITRERKGYAEAFARACSLAVDRISSFDVMGSECVVVYPDPPDSPIPEGLPRHGGVSACFQIDTFSKPEWRALWSCLFDYTFVFHPRHERYFKPYGHSRVILLPHAVQAEQFPESPLSHPRTFEVGWVGGSQGKIYATRRRLLPLLASRYRMNAWEQRYPESKVAGVYRQSRIVVNIGRDDHPNDANIRCFEVMASGALLVTSLPNELEQLGFKHGVHFVGYSTEDELFRVLNRFLNDEPARMRITSMARDLVMREHTYDARVEGMLRMFEQDNGEFFAPARQWSAGRVDFVYFHYHCKRVNLPSAQIRFQRLLRVCPSLALRGLPLLLRCWQHKLAKQRCERALRNSKAFGSSVGERP